MAQQTINIGTVANDGTGDPIRDAFDKTNDNFTEVYTNKLDKAGGTLTGDLIVPDEAYDATAWNGSLEVPTKNAVRDKIEALSVGTYTDEQARDAIAAMLAAGTHKSITVTNDDGGDAMSLAATPAVQSVSSSATVTPTFSDDLVKITAQAAGLTLANPTGTAIPGWGITIRIKDNGTARTIAYGTQYRAIGVTLPTSTVISKTLYLGMIYNSDDTKWDVVAVALEV